MGKRENMVESLVQELLSSDYNIRNRAITKARNLAEKGDETGLLALEGAVKVMSGNPQCEFYELRISVRPAESLFEAKSEILELAKQGKLLTDTKKTGELIAKLSFVLGNSYGEWGNFMSDLKSEAGESQLHAFQLLGEHNAVSSKLIMRARHDKSSVK